MRLFNPFLIILFLVLNQVVCGQTKVAILDFENTSNISKYDGFGKALSNMLITDLKNSIHPRKMTFIERSQLNKILDEQRLQQTKNFDNTTTVSFGKLAGVKYVILGNVYVLDGICNISARMVNVETSEIEYSKESNGEISKWLSLKSTLAEELSFSLNNPIEIEDSYKNLTTSEGLISQYTKVIEKMDEGDVDSANEMVDMLSAVQPEFKYFDELKNDIEILKRQVEQNTKDISSLSSALESELLDDPFQSANDFFNREEFDKAIKYYQFELERVNYWEVGKLLHLNHIIGLAHYNMNQFEESLEFLNTALSIYPHFAPAAQLKSILLLKLNSELFDEFASFHLENIYSGGSQKEYFSSINKYLSSKTKNRDSLLLIENQTGVNIDQGWGSGSKFNLIINDYDISYSQESAYELVLNNYADFLEGTNRSTINYIESLKKTYFESINVDSYNIPKINLINRSTQLRADYTNLTPEITESKNNIKVVQNLDLVYLNSGDKFENFNDFFVLRDDEGNYYSSRKSKNEFEYEDEFVELNEFNIVNELKDLLVNSSDAKQAMSTLLRQDYRDYRKSLKIKYKLTPRTNKFNNEIPIQIDSNSNIVFLSYKDSILGNSRVDFGIEIVSTEDESNKLKIDSFYNRYLDKSKLNAYWNNVSIVFDDLTRMKDSLWTAYMDFSESNAPKYPEMSNLDYKETQSLLEEYNRRYSLYQVEAAEMYEKYDSVNDIFYSLNRDISYYQSNLERIRNYNEETFVYSIFRKALRERESNQFKNGTCDCARLVQQDDYKSLINKGKIIGDYFVFNYDTNRIYDSRYEGLFFALGWYYMLAQNYEKSIMQWDEFISSRIDKIVKSENNLIENFLQQIEQYNFSSLSDLSRMAIINRIHAMYLSGDKENGLSGYRNAGIESVFSDEWSGLLLKDVLKEDYELFVQKGLISKRDQVELFQKLGI